MATKSFTNDITFEPKDVDNLIKALETDKKPNPIKSIKVKTITEPSEILKLREMKFRKISGSLSRVGVEKVRWP